MKKQHNHSRVGRRGVLGAMATITGSIVLRSLATGIPARILLDPLHAHANDEPNQQAKVLILSSSALGDPVNCHVPGACELADSNIVRPAGWDPMPVTVNNQTWKAAPIWNNYQRLEQTLFFHHKTGTPVHGDMDRVQRMLDTTDNNDMLVSLLAAELAKQHQGSYIQAAPVSVGARGGSELLSAGGLMLSNTSPRAVRQALIGINGPVAQPWVRELRDDTLTQLENLYRQRGTRSQRRMLDAWASARSSVRSLSQKDSGIDYGAMLATIEDDSALSQVTVAAVLAAIQLAPVITIHLGFGGDNHSDPSFEDEVIEHTAAIDQLNKLHELLGPNQLNAEKHTLVGLLNVFGRTFLHRAKDGRDHNMHHNVMMLSGPGVKGGVVGGVEKDPEGADYRALTIDSKTGQGVASGDISRAASLGAAGKTLGHAMGISEARLDELVEPGKVVHSPLG